jgi:hypothetical protein
MTTSEALTFFTSEVREKSLKTPHGGQAEALLSKSREAEAALKAALGASTPHDDGLLLAKLYESEKALGSAIADRELLRVEVDNLRKAMEGPAQTSPPTA